MSSWREWMILTTGNAVLLSWDFKWILPLPHSWNFILFYPWIMMIIVYQFTNHIIFNFLFCSYFTLLCFIFRRTITDKTTGKEITLTDEDIDFIEKIQHSQYPESSVDPYEVSLSFNAVLLYLLSLPSSLPPPLFLPPSFLPPSFPFPLPPYLPLPSPSLPSLPPALYRLVFTREDDSSCVQCSSLQALIPSLTVGEEEDRASSTRY